MARFTSFLTADSVSTFMTRCEPPRRSSPRLIRSSGGQNRAIDTTSDPRIAMSFHLSVLDIRRLPLAVGLALKPCDGGPRDVDLDAFRDSELHLLLVHADDRRPDAAVRHDAVSSLQVFEHFRVPLLLAARGKDEEKVED